MRKIFLAALLFLFLLPVSAENFIVRDYSVYITADDSKSLVVNEDITLDFTVPSHGFLRDIEYRFGNVKADVSDISSSIPCSISDDGSEVRLRFGDADRFVTGIQRYQYSYRYTLPADDYSDYDELYYNIVSADSWDSPMERVSFAVELPHPVDAERIWVTAGRYGSVSELPFFLSSDGRTVHGTYGNLPAGWAITLRVEMDDGYFSSASRPFPFYILSIVLSAAVLLIVFIIWYLKGRDEKLVVSPVFYPPEGISPMDAGYILNGTLSDEAVSAMLFYWAEKGYITIDDKGDDDFSFTLIAYPADATEAEQLLFSSFFSSETVDIKVLQANGFYQKMKAVEGKEAGRFSGSSSLYTSSSEKFRNTVAKLMIIPVILHAILSTLSFPGFFTIFLFIPSFMAYMLSMQIGRKAARAKSMKARLAAVLPFSFFIIFIGVFMFITLSQTGLLMPVVAAADTAVFLFSLIVSMILAQSIEKLSDYGRKMTESILGYREFIDKVEKDRIAKLSDDDPRAFYHVLPYAIVFGLEEKWTEAFRDIYVEPASWYSGGIYDPFIFSSFSRRWHRAYASHVMPQNTGARGGSRTFRGSSGHAGGGFSGGGGSSW